MLIDKVKNTGNHYLKYGDECIVPDPKDIRSVHDTFDPQRKHNANLLASLAALLGTGTMADYYNQGQ